MFELRAVFAELNLSKNSPEIILLDKHFLVRIVYLADIFSALCAVNTSHKGRDTAIFEACEQLGAYSNKLKLWKRRVKRGQLEHLHNFKIFAT